MDFNFYSEDVDLPDLNFDIIQNWLRDVIESHFKNAGNISIIFCSDKYLLDINIKYLNHKYFTDIITFNYSSKHIISGDLFISVDTVRNNSKIFESTFQNELCRVIVHGILHLLNFDDKTDNERLIMRQKEDFCLKILESKF